MLEMARYTTICTTTALHRYRVGLMAEISQARVTWVGLDWLCCDSFVARCANRHVMNGLKALLEVLPAGILRKETILLNMDCNNQAKRPLSLTVLVMP